MSKLIQHWPDLLNREESQVCVGSDYCEDDLWFDLGRTTLGDGGVLVIGLYSQDERHHVVRECLEKSGDVDLSRVIHFRLRPTVRTIRVQAQEAYRGGIENVGTGEVVMVDVPARPAGTVTRNFDKRFHLGDRRNLQLLIAAVNERASVRNIVKSYSDEDGDCPITAVVIMEPNLDEGDLNHLQEFRDACKQVDVYIFHRWDAEKYGVIVEGDPENWEDAFPALAEVKLEPQQVIVDDRIIKGNIHVDAGAPGAYKTMVNIEEASAILDERPAFDFLKVNHRYPVLFLCADMSPTQFYEYSAPFNLQKHGSDFRVMKGDILHEVDSPVLQRAVKGRILFLDTMLDFARIQKAFESGEWITFMQKLRNLITVHGCIAVKMTAHSTRAGVKSDSDVVDEKEYFKDSVTFHGKTDIGFGYKVLKGTSQVLVERIKHRGFKNNKFSFTLAVYDEQGNSNLDKGRFPICTRPEDMKEMKEQRRTKPGPKKDAGVVQQVLKFKVDGKSTAEIATLTSVSESTVKRYISEYEEGIERLQGEQQ